MKNAIQLVFLIIIFIALYFSIGIFVIQPIGAIPEGATIIYFRLSSNLPFISSADGYLIAEGKPVSLTSRAIVMGQLLEHVNKNRILTLPYSKKIYLTSTNGVELAK